MKRTDLIGRVAEIERQLTEKGYEIDLTFDPNAALKIMNDVGKKAMHPVSEISDSDLKKRRAFWVGVRQGETYCACIAARQSHVSQMGFGEYWAEHCHSKYPSRRSVVASVSEEANTQISGAVVYFGGVEVAKGKQGNLSRLIRLVEYSKIQAALLWEFDCIFTIINADHRAMSRLYKFSTILEKAVLWHPPIPAGLSDDQLYLVDHRETFEARLSAQPR